jgi:chromosome segregation ATPase
MHGVSAALAHVSGRVQELATQVEGAGQGYAERELELTALTRAFEEAKSGVEALGSQVRSEVQELARAGGAELDERLETLTAQMDDLRARLLELDAASASAREDSSGVRAELTQVIASVERRVEALASEHAASAAELRAALEAATEERESLAAGSRLLEERMRGVAEAAATAAGPDPALEAHLQELGAQVSEGRQRVATLTSDLQGALDSLSVRLDGLGADVEAVARVRADKEHEVAELALRFEQAGAKVDSLVGDLQRSLESVPEQKPDSELEGRFELLGQRLDTLAAAVEARAGSRETDLLLGKVLLRLDSLEREQESLAAELESAPAGAGSSEDELAELRLLIEGVRMRLAAKEDELSAIGGAQDVATRLDEVAARLDRLEETGANATPGEGLPADGRLRRELRELEHRMEHAEAAARENREAVLVQIERLASRVEWRLQQLESEEPVAEGEKPAPASVPKARVVPIRGSDV